MKTGYKIEVFSKKQCSGCEQVKNLLNVRGLVYKEILVDEPSGSGREQLLIRLPNARSVPQVFINNRHIGGVHDLVKELSSNDYY